MKVYKTLANAENYKERLDLGMNLDVVILNGEGWPSLRASNLVDPCYNDDLDSLIESISTASRYPANIVKERINVLGEH